MILDNTALSTFLTCPAKYDLRMMQNWAPKKVSSALNAGKVLHRGLEEWYRTGNLVQSLQACKDEWPAGLISDDFRTLEKVLSTLVEYTKRWSSEPWTILEVEQSFTQPTGLWLNLCPNCRRDCSDVLRDMNEGETPTCYACDTPLEPIEYGGIFDLLVEWSGKLYVLDHKTTTQFGSYYNYQWRPNNQITGYVWGAQQLSGRPVDGAIINITAWYKSSATKFDRHITNREPVDVAHWLENLRRVANIIHRARLLGEFPQNTSACTLYGLCEFHKVHERADPQQQAGMLSMYYEQRPWDHERRDEAAPTG